MIGTKVEEAKNLLVEGKVVAIPTETVYGLAANAFKLEAVARIFEVKNRPNFNPLIVHVASLAEAKKLTQNFPDDALKLAEAFWPGPLTLLLPKNQLINDLVTAQSPLVAIRVPNHPLTLQLLQSVDFPLVAPSANPYQFLSPTSAMHIEHQLGNKIDYILDGGDCKTGIESTIVGFENNQVIIYRIGSLTRDKIEKVLNKTTRLNSNSEKHLPGNQKIHYAPSKKFFLGNIPQLLGVFKNKKLGVLSFEKSYKANNIALNKVLSPEGNLNEAATNLFNYLHQLNNADVDAIIAEKAPNQGLGFAINDRLERAAG